MNRIALALSVMIMFLPVLSKAEDSAENNIGRDSYLFVLSANSGTIKDDTLTLKGVSSAVYFSDRPATTAGHKSRIAGHKSMKDFEGMWAKSSDSFNTDPPNATLSILNKDGAVEIVVELLSMKHAGDLCTFKVKVLEGNAPESFGPSSLFIDNKIIGIDLGGG